MYRVITYVDGFNLYYGLRDKNLRRYYWLDLCALSRSFLTPRQEFVRCHYFTARIRNTGEGSGDGSQNRKRQNIWLDALGTYDDLTIHYGHYLAKPQKCRQCGSTWNTHEEKMTDVNIATQLLVDAYENNFDTAMIISGDSDLTTPVKRIRERFPEKRVTVAFPPGRRSAQLQKAASTYFVIGENKLRKCLMPDSITTANGFTLNRPDRWR